MKVKGLLVTWTVLLAGWQRQAVQAILVTAAATSKPQAQDLHLTTQQN
jgi:hypothetical protein